MDGVSALVLAPDRPGEVGRAARPAPGRRRPTRVARRRRRNRRIGFSLVSIVLVLLVGLGSFLVGLLNAPFDEKQVPPPPKAVLVMASDGTQIGSILPVERRELVPTSAIPQVMRDAIIAAEDERFLEHNGVDVLGTTRAFLRDVTGNETQGGSTLTQQYVKNVYVGNERTLTRKIKEAAIAVRLEQRESKDQILTNYLNVLFLGNGTYGVQAASRYYFGVDVKDLDLDTKSGKRDDVLALARASMLAGIVPAPSAFNPVQSMELARARQRYVLNRLVYAGKITPEQAGDAFERPVTIVKETPPQPPSTAPEFEDMVESQIKAQYAKDEDLLFRGGLRVQTTLDTDWQSAITQAVHEVLPNDSDPEAAVVALDPRNGDVKALTTLRRVPEVKDKNGNVVQAAVQGYDRGGFDLATNAHRSTGSTIKPFTLAVALEKGHSLDERRSAPACGSIPNPGGKPDPYTYCNAGDSGYGGTLSLRQALQRSVNTVYVPLAIQVGRADIANLVQAAGAKADPAHPINPGNLSFGLGAGVEVTPLSMANAFGTIINNGIHVAPRFLLDTKNEAGALVQPAPQPQGSQVIPQAVAQQVTLAMSGVTADAGTAPRARQPFPVYGKTGTTDDSTDAWFIGCVKEPYNMCLATWMGYEDQSCTGVVGGACGGMKNLHGFQQVYGGTLPAEVFAKAMDIYRGIEAKKAAGAAPAADAGGPAPPSATPSKSAVPRKKATRAPAAPVAPQATVAPAAPAPAPTRAPAPTTAATTPAPAPSRSSGILPPPPGQAAATGPPG